MNGKMGKAPAFMFYASDWLTDPSLRMCSHETKGVWIDLLCHMFLSPSPGFLMVGDHILTKKEIQKVCGITPKKFEKVWSELRNFGILKQAENGCYFSSRMVKDEAIRQVRRQAGALGGNPQLKKKVNNLDKQSPNQTGKQNPTPSISYSLSEEKQERKGEQKEKTNVPTKKKPVKPEKPLHKLQQMIISEFKEVSKLKTQITADECEKLLGAYSWEQISDVLSRMDNYKKLLTSYTSVYRTALNWLKLDEKRNNQNGGSSGSGSGGGSNLDNF